MGKSRLAFDRVWEEGDALTQHGIREDPIGPVERAPLGSTSGTTQSGTTDVAGNWEPKPDFEDICTLLRSER